MPPANTPAPAGDSRMLYWNVRVSRFPFSGPGDVVGVVTATDRAEAEQKARALYGAGTVVERATGTQAPDVTRRGAAARLDPDAARRTMTASEAQMAKAVACCPLLRHSQHRGAMRALHARSLSADRSISEAESTILRACVVAFAAVLDRQVVALASEPAPAAAGGGR